MTIVFFIFFAACIFGYYFYDNKYNEEIAKTTPNKLMTRKYDNWAALCSGMLFGAVVGFVLYFLEFIFV